MTIFLSVSTFLNKHSHFLSSFPFLFLETWVDGSVMPLAVELLSTTKNMGDTNQASDKLHLSHVETSALQLGVNKQQHEQQVSDDDDDEYTDCKIHLGPQFSIKQQLEKDKDDESLRRWKEQLLGSVDISSAGAGVDKVKEMIGTFGPQKEAYTHEMAEETTPWGMFARGSYSAKSKFYDDDNKSYLEMSYTFDIRREWLAIPNLTITR